MARTLIDEDLTHMTPTDNAETVGKTVTVNKDNTVTVPSESIVDNASNTVAAKSAFKEAHIEDFLYPEEPFEFQIDEERLFKFEERQFSSEQLKTCETSANVTEAHDQTTSGESLTNLAQTEKAYEVGFSLGRTEGLREGLSEGEKIGRKAERESVEQSMAGERGQRSQQAAELLRGFSQEAEHYLHQVEHEVVRLALAIAARILRREAQMDPLLLTGAVRVALGQLTESTRVTLQVPEEDIELWTDAIRLAPNLGTRPVVVVEEGLKLGDCRLKAEMGSVDLGLRAQLAEIERGFFDRIGKHSRRSNEQVVTRESNGSQTTSEQRVEDTPLIRPYEIHEEAR